MEIQATTALSQTRKKKGQITFRCVRASKQSSTPRRLLLAGWSCQHEKATQGKKKKKNALPNPAV